MTANVTRIVVACGLLGLVLAAGVGGPQLASSQDRDGKGAPRKKTVEERSTEHSKFMRQKLEATSKIVEGLVTDDSELVTDGAKVLVEMSSAEKWQVQNNVMYKQYSAEFQQAARRLLESAEKDNLDRAALQWIDATMSCIDCHKFVRGASLAAGQK